MKTRAIPRAVVLAVGAVLLAAAEAAAQPPPPSIGCVYPAGAQRGTTCRVVVRGQALRAAEGVTLTGPGVEARIVQVVKPMTGKEASELRERAKKLAAEAKEKKDPKVLPELRAIREKLLAFANKPPPALADVVIIEVTVAPDAPPGRRALRLEAPNGRSNPLVFCIDAWPEQIEAEAKPGRQGPKSEPPVVPVPAVLNGVIMPGEVDRVHFDAAKGQEIVAAAWARALVPYLADAVPGWFQATLALYDAEGRELAYVDDFRFDPDPVLHFTVPADGRYTLEIKDAIYRGREDFVYRIVLGELPYVTGVFPLGGRAGERTEVTLAGWNLPKTRLTVDNRTRRPGVHPLGAGAVNPVPFAVDDLPDRTETEPNDTPDAARAVPLETIVNGRIDRPGDRDVFRFEGRAGQEIVAEVTARRLGSPLDSYLWLTDASGRTVAQGDDHVDQGEGLATHHADAYLWVELPADGTYDLTVGDVQGQGGPAHAYRLRLSRPRPDFELRVAPSSPRVRGGTAVPLEVHAIRRDGFTGPIRLALKDAPAGFALGGAVVPEGQDAVRVTLAAPPKGSKTPVRLVLEGAAIIGGREVVRTVVPAEDRMQAFIYRHLVPADALEVLVVGRGSGPPRILSDLPVRIPAGGTARVRAGLPTKTARGEIELELSDPPEGVVLGEVLAAQGGGTIMVLEADPEKATPGLRGNLIVTAYTMRRPPSKPDAPPRPARRVLLGSLPAIPFEVVAP